MPHESTVRHEDKLPEGVEVMANRSREAEEREEVIKRRRLKRSDSIVPHLFAMTPRQCTQVGDDDGYGEDCTSD